MTLYGQKDLNKAPFFIFNWQKSVHISEHFHLKQKRSVFNKCFFYCSISKRPSRGPLYWFLKYGHPNLLYHVGYSMGDHSQLMIVILHTPPPNHEQSSCNPCNVSTALSSISGSSALSLSLCLNYPSWLLQLL